MLAAVECRHADARRTLFLEAWEPGAGWTTDPRVLSRLITLAAGASPASPDAGALERALGILGDRLHTHFRRTLGEVHAGHRTTRSLLARIRALAAESVRRRDTAALETADRAMRFIRGGHTAGETLLLEDLLRMTDRELRIALTGLPPRPPPPASGVPRLVALVLFRNPA
jgi:hypothetical protein